MIRSGWQCAAVLMGLLTVTSASAQTQGMPTTGNPAAPVAVQPGTSAQMGQQGPGTACPPGGSIAGSSGQMGQMPQCPPNVGSSSLGGAGTGTSAQPGKPTSLLPTSH